MRDIEQAPGEPGNEWRLMLERLKSNAESISYTIDMLIEVLAKVESKAHAGKLSEARGRRERGGGRHGGPRLAAAQYSADGC
jgi:hypothetical protein